MAHHQDNPKSFTISNPDSKVGPEWAASYSSLSEAAEAVRQAYEWDTVALSDVDNAATAGEHDLCVSVYPNDAARVADVDRTAKTPLVYIHYE